MGLRKNFAARIGTKTDNPPLSTHFCATHLACLALLINNLIENSEYKFTFRFFYFRIPDNCTLPEATQFADRGLQTGQFQFNKGSKFVYDVMVEMNRTYDQNRDTYMAAGIPIPFRVAKKFLNREQVYNTNSKLASK